MIPAYYNEIEPYCAQWLRNLIDAGHIPAGEVDERDIREVHGDDLKGYGQCHFFAGIGGWGYAARLAGIPDDQPLWTGSCPCQPLSSAGQRKGHADERHLWPAFYALIAQRRPATVFGEQVASKLGREWLAGVRADLETLGYALGAADLPAACVGAPQRRDRLWFVARHDLAGLQGQSSTGQQPEPQQDSRYRTGTVASGRSERLPACEREAIPGARRRQEGRAVAKPDHSSGLLGDGQGDGWREGWTEHDLRSRGITAAVASVAGRQFIECPDGKWRRLPPPRVRWLGNGIPARVGKLRGYGNAIYPKLAAAFMKAVMEVRP